MGDRANVRIIDDCDPELSTYLYTHNKGTELPEIVRRALAKRWRWGDASYLTRIIFCEMVDGDEKSETGFGISATRGDYNHPDIVIDCKAQMVSKEDETWTFEQYIEEGAGR